MIGSVKDQNKQLKEAGQKRVDTSPRRIKADTFSAKVAASGAKSEAQDQAKVSETARSEARQIKASYEGLMHSPSTVIQLNGVGYDNKAIQKARYLKEVSPFSKKFLDNSSNTRSNYSIMNNYSGSFKKDSSSSRLNNIVKSNMMFK